MKRILSNTLALLSVLYLLLFFFTTKQDTKQDNDYSTYENIEHNVTLEYCKDWKQNFDYYNRFEGKEGFFQITAFDGLGWSIDEVANYEAAHKLLPYGSNPEISKLSLDGMEARLIMPSNDQAKEMNNQAEIIIKYPITIEINGSTFSYFILYANSNHILKIAKTVKFISR